MFSVEIYKEHQITSILRVNQDEAYKVLQATLGKYSGRLKYNFEYIKIDNTEKDLCLRSGIVLHNRDHGIEKLISMIFLTINPKERWYEFSNQILIIKINGAILAVMKIASALSCDNEIYFSYYKHQSINFHKNVSFKSTIGNMLYEDIISLLFKVASRQVRPIKSKAQKSGNGDNKA